MNMTSKPATQDNLRPRVLCVDDEPSILAALAGRCGPPKRAASFSTTAANAMTRPVGSGTGRGLSISYDIVKKHGGQIEVDSQPGTGTRIRLYLPVGSKVQFEQ